MFDFLKNRKLPLAPDYRVPAPNDNVEIIPATSKPEGGETPLATKSRSQIKRETVQKEEPKAKTRRVNSFYGAFLKTRSDKEREAFAVNPLKACFSFRSWVDKLTNEELVSLLVK